MKVVAVFVAILATSLAAPRDVASNDEKVVTPVETVNSENLVPNRKVDEILPSESSNEDKIGIENVDKVEDEDDDKVIVKGEDEVEDEVEDEDEDKVEEKDEDKVDEKVDDKVKENVEPEITLSKEEAVVNDSAEKKRKARKNEEEEKKAEAAKDLSEYSAVCRASTGATIEQISAISEEPAENAPREVKCYVRCIAEHLGIVKEQVLQKDVAVASKPSTLSADELDVAVDTCSNLKTDDPCDSSYLRYSCYFRTTGKKVRIF